MSQEDVGGPRKLREASGSHARPREARGNARRHRRQQEAPRGPQSKRFQKAAGVVSIPCVLRLLL
eukprot:5066527-Pyramimonas_sp.AAC.1